MAEKYETVDAYIESFPAEIQAILQEIRRTILQAIPDAEQKISYQIPTFTRGGKSVIYFAGYRDHVSVYPVPADEAFQSKIALYRSGKGTLRFPLATPIPYDIIAATATLLAAERQTA